MAVTFNHVTDLDRALPYCKNRLVAVQAGGNAGVWPLYLAERFAEVHTFEPEETTFAALDQNCAGKRIRCYWAALGSKFGHIGVRYPHGLCNMGAVQVGDAGGVPMWPLDTLKLEHCDLLQLDVEGYEVEVLKGAMETIRRCHPVIMVEDKGLSVDYGMPQGWSDTWLAKEGYRVVDRVARDVILVHGG